MSQLTFIDLFSGIGGFHQALKNIGANCVFASDNDEKCNEIYFKNYGIKPEGDITKIEPSKIPKFDILCGGFPCFVGGTMVLTYHGYKRIEEVLISDKLYTHTGSFQKILNTQIKKYCGTIKEIKVDGRPVISCTPEHPFYVKMTPLSKPEWLSADKMNTGMYVGIKINEESIIPTVNDVFLSDPNYWHIMGYLLGSSQIGYDYISFRAKNLYRIADELILIKLGYHNYRAESDIWIPILKHFNKNGLFKKIPEFVQNAPINLISSFLKGWEDSDPNMNYVVVDQELALELQRLYMKSGYKKKWSVYFKDNEITKRTVNQGKALEIKHHVKGHRDFGYFWTKVDKISDKISDCTIDTYVYNFEVEHDNSYTVYNTHVHNCQPFSKAGFQKGFDDDRGNLFFSIAKIAKCHKPKYMLLENVRNLSSHDSGNTWNIIRDTINDLGYHTYEEPVILNVLDFNVPQNRERVIIMCKRKDLGPLPKSPTVPKNSKKTLTNTLNCIMDLDEKGYQLNDKMKDVERIWNLFIATLKSNNIDMPKFPIWTDWFDNVFLKTDPFYKKYENWICKNRAFYSENIDLLKPWLEESRLCSNWFGAVRKFEWQAGDLLPDDSMNAVLWTARSSGIRCKRPDYAPTLVAMSMIPVYGPLSRKMSPKELLKLQCFKDDFVYIEKNIYKQLGNSVNVKMIERCARFLILNEELF